MFTKQEVYSERTKRRRKMLFVGDFSSLHEPSRDKERVAK